MDVNSHEFDTDCNETVVLDPRITLTNVIAYEEIAPVIIAVGILGNLLTILILRQPQFRGVTYTYFLILAVSDVASLLFSISFFFHLTHETTLWYSSAVWYSYLELFFANVFLSTSTFIVICVTVDRYYCVCRPAKFKTIHTQQFARNMIIGSFVIPVLVWLPMCFIKSPREYGDCDCVCSTPPDNRTRWVACMDIPQFPTTRWYFIYSWIRQTLVTFIPVVILVLLNSLTLRGFIKLKKRRREMERKSICFIATVNASQAVAGRQQHDQNLINLLTAVMVSFFFTMVPVGIFNAAYSESHCNDYYYQIFRAVVNDLEILNHAMNFYLYILYSKPIRLALKNYVRTLCSSCSCPSALVSILSKIKKVCGCLAQSTDTASNTELYHQEGIDRYKLNQNIKSSSARVQPQQHDLKKMATRSPSTASGAD